MAFDSVHLQSLLAPSPSIRVDSPMENNDAKPFACERCIDTFASLEELQRHQRRHDYNRPFGCEVEGCGVRCGTDEALQAHFESYHGPNARVRPPRVQSVRTSVDKKECDTCGKTFKRATNYHRHLLVHIDAASRRCTVEGCTETFKRGDNLRRHVALHQQAGGPAGASRPVIKRDRIRAVYPRTCPHCATVCQTRIQWYNHERSHKHNVYPCAYCDKEFNLIGNRNRHQQQYCELGPRERRKKSDK